MKVFALGRPRCGKTYLARLLTAAVVGEGIPAIVHDPRGEFPEKGPPSREPGFAYVRSADLKRYNAAAPITIVREATPESAEAVCAAAVAYAKRYRAPVLVVLNEMIFACFQRKWLAPSARDIALNGRHLGGGVGIIGCAIRPQSLDPMIWEVADWVACFKMEGPAVQRMFREWSGDELCDAVAALPMPSNDGSHYIRWSGTQ